MEIKFGTGGFRGVIGDDFCKLNITKVAKACAHYLIKNKYELIIPVGFDYRFLSEEAAIWMSEIFAYEGIKVLLFKTASPSPAVMYQTQKLKVHLGVMITASHNPYIFNGIKIFEYGGYDAGVDITNDIENEINNISDLDIKSLDLKIAEKKGLIQRIDGLSEYVDLIYSYAKNINPNIKIAYENLNGVAYLSLSKLFEKLEIKNTYLLNKNRDPLFGGKMPNPIEANLDDLKKLVIEQKCDVGFACDSDGDRLGIIDELGNYVSSNEILALIDYYLIKYEHKNGGIVKNCATGNLINQVAKIFNQPVYEVDVGFKNITHTMSANNCIIGGESSGGLTIDGYLHGKDSSFAIIMFLNAMGAIKKPVSEIIKELKNVSKYNQFVTESFISYKKENEKKILEYLNNNDPKFEYPLLKKEVYGRNFKYYFKDDQWILIRLSGTEPVFRIFSEMNKKEEALNDIKELEKYVRGIE